ncbi:MAG: CoA transferase [Novosphingobium sp.]|nr:CoA transferase [Novosphingobium sp.]
MTSPLAGVKIVELAMWAFVPSAGGILSDMGADVIKIEPPAGDPIRGLATHGLKPGSGPFNLSFENYNRGKRSITLDLKVEGSLEVLHRLLDDADVFLTNILPPARRKMKVDIDDIRARRPDIIYAIGSGAGLEGPDGEKGGYDAITYWSRGGISHAVTPPEQPYPLPMPSGAFGDTSSGSMLAGAIAAALYQRATTGKGSIVDVSLLGASMWTMQSHITQAILQGMDELPMRPRTALPNPLVNTYRTSDDRYLALCMLQGQRYWAGFCVAIDRPDLAADERFATEEERGRNVNACVAILDEVFATRPLAEWTAALARQPGQWDVVRKPGELRDDPQVRANTYLQSVDYGDGLALDMVSTPMRFDRQALVARPAPEKGAHNDEVLASLGYDEDQIIDLKVAGIIY